MQTEMHVLFHETDVLTNGHVEVFVENDETPFLFRLDFFGDQNSNSEQTEKKSQQKRKTSLAIRISRHYTRTTDPVQTKPVPTNHYSQCTHTRLHFDRS